MSMFSFQAIHNHSGGGCAVSGLFIDYVNVLFSSNSQQKKTGRKPGIKLFIDYVNVLFSSNSQRWILSYRLQKCCLSIMSMFSFQAIHNAQMQRLRSLKLFIDYVNVLFSSNSQLYRLVASKAKSCLSIMSMFSFQAIHNPLFSWNVMFLVVYRLCQCSLFKQFTTWRSGGAVGCSCLSIMSMFSFQAIHNEPSRFIFRCKGTIFFGQCQIYFSRCWKINTLLF